MTTIQEVVLQIKDKNVKWENNVEEVYFKKKKSLFFFATYTYCPDACPNCGCVNRDFSIVKTSIVDLNAFISKNVKNEIKVKACETVSKSHIAKEMDVSVHTIRRVVNETAESLRIKP